MEKIKDGKPGLYKVYGKYNDGTEYSDEFNTVSIIIYLLGGGNTDWGAYGF